jgi:nitrogenase molybdenum-cofactor synthesis protein NifE
VEAVCKKVSAKTGIDVIPVHSEGFKGTKKDGYAAACDAIMRLVGSESRDTVPLSINIMGEFNLAGEAWMIRGYFERMGIRVLSTMTGDGRVADLRAASGAALNVVQCSGSMQRVAVQMKERFGTPFERVSFFGIEDTADALYRIAGHFKNDAVMENTRQLVAEEIKAVYPAITRYRTALQGRRAAVYVGGAFKAISLVGALRMLSMEVVLVGSQTGNADDYERLRRICSPDTIIIDDANPLELSRFAQETRADLFIGGVKERPIAMKLGIGFCDHNHERRIALAGFVGMKNFADEVFRTTLSPVWSLFRKKAPYEP